MDKKYKISLIIGLLLVFMLAGVTFFFIAGGNGASSGDSDSSSVIWIIMASQIPIWISLAAASQQKLKKKKVETMNTAGDYQPEDADYFADKVLSDEGEIVSYDEIDESRRMKSGM